MLTRKEPLALAGGSFFLTPLNKQVTRTTRGLTGLLRRLGLRMVAAATRVREGLSVSDV
jgi:hypothetical protein